MLVGSGQGAPPRKGTRLVHPGGDPRSDLGRVGEIISLECLGIPPVELVEVPGRSIWASLGAGGKSKMNPLNLRGAITGYCGIVYLFDPYFRF